MSLDPAAITVVCPHCLKLSTDTSFCEHCQYEIPTSTAGSAGHHEASESPADPVTKCVEWNNESAGLSWPDDPYPSFEVEVDAKLVRVHGVHPRFWAELQPQINLRQACDLDVLPPIQIIQRNGGALIAAEVWRNPSAVVGHRIIAGSDPVHIDDLFEATLATCQILNRAMTGLHSRELVWLEFDPAAVEIKDEQVRITNMDWRLFPFRECPTRFARISPVYSPPEVCRFRDDLIGPETDVYHLALFAWYRLAGLWPTGFGGGGLEQFGFEIPPLRVYRPDLPIGIWPVLHRALSIHAGQRYATPGEMLHDLKEATRTSSRNRLPKVVDSGVRAEPGGSSDLRDKDSAAIEIHKINADRLMEKLLPGGVDSSSGYDIGWKTDIGRAKHVLGSVNQDRVVVSVETVCGRLVWLTIVADGVTNSRAGTGDRASEIACQVLADLIRARIASLTDCEVIDWPAILSDACVAASEAIICDALSLADRPTTLNDNDLMSTTALIGVVDGDEMFIANVGDSRAYFVAHGVAEQLTVDGDVAMSRLAQRTPPEQVRELGTAGKALRYCLGAARVSENGGLEVDRDRAKPMVCRWQIQPGDTIILCSDGLVEERVFLEPEDLVTLIEANRDMTSQQLADRLVAAADSKQRLPSSNEPNGYGDNISCVVVYRRYPQSSAIGACGTSGND